MVIGESGACIEGATIQIVGAQGAGEPIPQRTPCGVWDYDGGLLLTDLTPGVEVTLRGAASGYTPREMSFLPFPMPGSYKPFSSHCRRHNSRLSDSCGNSREVVRTQAALQVDPTDGQTLTRVGTSWAHAL